MKDIRFAIRSLLLANATVSNLVGGNRVFPIKAPQGETEPSLVYNRITELEYMVMDGSAKLMNTQMQIDSWAEDADAAVELANATHDALIGVSGLIEYGTNSPRDYVDVKGIFLSTSREDYDDIAAMFRHSRDYHFWYVSQ